MGLFEWLTVYIWNWVVFGVAAGGLSSAWSTGLWGLFWADDDGLLTNELLKMWGGNTVEFPVDYNGWTAAGEA